VGEERTLVLRCCDQETREPIFYLFFNARLKIVEVARFGSMKYIIENQEESLDEINNLLFPSNIKRIYVMGHEGCLAYKMQGLSDNHQLLDLMKTAQLLQDNFVVPTIPVWQRLPEVNGKVPFYKVDYKKPGDLIYTRLVGIDINGEIRIHTE
jgi:hypothetical protein